MVGGAIEFGGVGTFSIFSFISIEGIWVGFGSVGGGGTEEGIEVGRDEVETGGKPTSF